MTENLFEIPDGLKSNSEIFKTLLKSKKLKIEKIVSNNSSSAKDFWFDQPESEWVCVLQGSAVLEFAKPLVSNTPCKKLEESCNSASSSHLLKLQKGNFFLIKPHQKHRVKSTSKKCVWLCVFF